MSDFNGYAFEEDANKSKTAYQDFDSMIKEFTEGLESYIAPYKPKLMKEFESLEKNNKKWKEEHNGADCMAFKQKMWALSAPTTAVSILRELYLNRTKKTN